MTRLLRYLLVVGAAIVCILLFLLASASENSAFFDRHYSWLLGLNALIAVALFGLVILLLVRLYKRYRRGRFGSKLMARLVLLFATFGILPGILIYVVSVQFVSRSIESWFDVRVESALEAGLNLGRSALDTSLADLVASAHSMALELSDHSHAGQVTLLARLREQRQMTEALIVTSSGRIIASSGGSLGQLVPELPTGTMLQQARVRRAYQAVEGVAESPALERPAGASASQALAPGADTLRLRVVVGIPIKSNTLSLQSEASYLQLIQPVPTQLAADAEALRAAYSEYQERRLARTGLRKIYIVTLTLTLLLAIFGALTCAFLIANNLARPLLLLAQGTKAVAEGNLSPRPIIASRDELGTLTQSFNTMTRQLFEARAAVEKNRVELENAKAYLESVLANMSAGVMVLDGQFRLVSCNASVERILHQDLSQSTGKPLQEIAGLETFATAVTSTFSDQSARSAANNADIQHGAAHWQQQIELQPRQQQHEGEHGQILLTRGSRLPIQGGDGYIVVFDDISDVISGQRSIAWGEVARRLAHEIKNPLTPIQLSAERLQMKLEGKLAEPDASMLNKGTATIINQVTAMKRMVDDFRDYARTPPAVLSRLSLNALIEEILGLYMAGDERDIIHAHLAADLPQIMGDATQLRQIIHNLLQNAQDAVTEHKAGSQAPRIDVRTEAIHYQGSDGKARTAVRLSIIDNGPGFAAKILARAFEPYITTKPRGTGLGLAMVKKIVEEHGGQIDIQNRGDANGAKISILFLQLASTAKTPEQEHS